jgi:hypothetical protein
MLRAMSWESSEFRSHSSRLEHGRRTRGPSITDFGLLFTFCHSVQLNSGIEHHQTAPERPQATKAVPFSNMLTSFFARRRLLGWRRLKFVLICLLKVWSGGMTRMPPAERRHGTMDLTSASRLRTNAFSIVPAMEQ